MQNCEEWGREHNLELCWTQTERGMSENGVWEDSRALVWLRQPFRIAASVIVRDATYAIYTQGLYGMSDGEMSALKKHLESKGLTNRDIRVGI